MLCCVRYDRVKVRRGSKGRAVLGHCEEGELSG